MPESAQAEVMCACRDTGCEGTQVAVPLSELQGTRQCPSLTRAAVTFAVKFTAESLPEILEQEEAALAVNPWSTHGQRTLWVLVNEGPCLTQVLGESHSSQHRAQADPQTQDLMYTVGRNIQERSLCLPFYNYPCVNILLSFLLF